MLQDSLHVLPCLSHLTLRRTYVGYSLLEPHTCLFYVNFANQGSRPSVFGNSNCGVASFSLPLTFELYAVSLSSIAGALNFCVVCVNTMMEIIQPKTSTKSCAIAKPQATVCGAPFVSYSFYHTTLLASTDLCVAVGLGLDHGVVGRRLVSTRKAPQI